MNSQYVQGISFWVLLFLGASLWAPGRAFAQEAVTAEISVEDIKTAVGPGAVRKAIIEFEKQGQATDATYGIQLKAFQGELEDKVQTLNEQYVNAIDKEKSRLVAKLEEARKAAIAEEKVDEAIRITEAKKYFVELAPTPPSTEAALSPPVPAKSKIQIISAHYGQNVSWLDVTAKIRSAVEGQERWSYTVNTKDLGEPAPQFTGPRTLLVRYSVGNKVASIAVYQGGTITLP